MRVGQYENERIEFINKIMEVTVVTNHLSTSDIIAQTSIISIQPSFP